MAATKTSNTIIAAATSVAATATQTGNPIDLRTAYGGFLTAKILNGSTAPSVAPALNLYVSQDNSDWTQIFTQSGGLVNAGLSQFGYEIPESVMYVRADVVNSGNQAVTVECFLQTLTGI